MEKLQPIAVGFVKGGEIIAEALSALGFEVGTCDADWVMPDAPPNTRLLCCPVGDIGAAKIMVAALAERLASTGRPALSKALGPFAAVMLPDRVVVVFLAWPGEAEAITQH
jgi:hypothetical protein